MAHVAAGLADTARRRTADGDRLLLELLCAVSFAHVRRSTHASLMAIDLAGVYDKPRIAVLLTSIAETVMNSDPVMARDCAAEGSRRAREAGNHRWILEWWYALAETADRTRDDRLDAVAAIAHDHAERLGRPERTHP